MKTPGNTAEQSQEKQDKGSKTKDKPHEMRDEQNKKGSD